MLWRRLALRTRILIGYGAGLLLMAALIGFLLFQLEQISRQVTDINANAAAEARLGAQLAAQAWGVGVTLAWSATVAFIAYKLVDLTLGLRVSEDKEREGLDTTEHGEHAYND